MKAIIQNAPIFPGAVLWNCTTISQKHKTVVEKCFKVPTSERFSELSRVKLRQAEPQSPLALDFTHDEPDIQALDGP